MAPKVAVEELHDRIRLHSVDYTSDTDRADPMNALVDDYADVVLPVVSNSSSDVVMIDISDTLVSGGKRHFLPSLKEKVKEAGWVLVNSHLQYAIFRDLLSQQRSRSAGLILRARELFRSDFDQAYMIATGTEVQGDRLILHELYEEASTIPRLGEAYEIDSQFPHPEVLKQVFGTDNTAEIRAVLGWMSARVPMFHFPEPGNQDYVVAMGNSHNDEHFDVMCLPLDHEFIYRGIALGSMPMEGWISNQKYLDILWKASEVKR